jgi:ADP-heptose:LPS heptosyltransferase
VHVFPLVENMSLARYAALLARARLVLGVDSGPLHLAAAVGTPSVRLHGPSDPRVFGPWGAPELHRVVASDLPCAPCGRLDYAPAELARHPCLRLIAPESVLDAARLVLAAHAARPPVVSDPEHAAHGVATGGAPW